MNYNLDEFLGSAVVAIGTAAVNVGTAGYNYYEATRKTRDYNADMELINAKNTEQARNDARRSRYAENFEKVFGHLDAEKTKRYLIIGSAIGVPLLAALILSKKG